MHTHIRIKRVLGRNGRSCLCWRSAGTEQCSHARHPSHLNTRTRGVAFKHLLFLNIPAPNCAGQRPFSRLDVSSKADCHPAPYSCLCKNLLRLIQISQTILHFPKQCIIFDSYKMSEYLSNSESELASRVSLYRRVRSNMHVFPIFLL